MSNNIQDKVVVITGASSGLGEAAARHLAGQGAKLVLGARRVDRLEKLVAAIRADGGAALAVATDVTRRDDVENLIQRAIAEFGHVDVLINNAGVMPMSAMARLRVEEWDQMIDVNIKGVLYGIAAVLPGMQTRKSGHIINLSSVAGLRVSAGIGTVYSATKFAVKALSEGLRAEVAGDNIRVTVVATGLSRASARRQPISVVQGGLRTGTDNMVYTVPVGGLGGAVGTQGAQPGSSHPDYGSMAVPSVWRTNRTQAAARVDALSSGGMDDLEIPAFLRKQAD